MTISRRQFCGAVGASIAAANESLFAADTEPRPLRVIAYNIYKCTGRPNDRPLAKRAVAKGQMAKRLAMELALHEPDIINFSESPSERLTKEVAELLEMNHVRFPSGGSWPGTLLSKFEIIESQNAPMKGERPKELFTRHWGRGTINVLSTTLETVWNTPHSTQQGYSTVGAQLGRHVSRYLQSNPREADN